MPETLYECPTCPWTGGDPDDHVAFGCALRKIRVFREDERALELTAGQAAAIRGMRQTAPHTLTPHPTDPGALLVKDARGRRYHLTHTGAATRLTTEDETHA